MAQTEYHICRQLEVSLNVNTDHSLYYMLIRQKEKNNDIMFLTVFIGQGIFLLTLKWLFNLFLNTKGQD